MFDLNGNFSHTLDSKGRIIIPSIFREAFLQPFTIGFNNDFSAIAFYPGEKWAEKCLELAKISESDIKGMQYVRLIRSFSFVNQTMDAQGRIILPLALRQQTKIDKAIRLVGMGPYMEVWDEESFTSQFMLAKESSMALLDHVMNTYYRTDAGQA